MNDPIRCVLYFILWVGVLASLGCVVYGAVWVLTPYGPNFIETATVKALSYHKAQNHTGVGPAIGGSGGMAVTTSHSDAEYSVVLKLDSGRQWIVDNEKFFNEADQGARFNLTIRLKRIFGEDQWDLVSWEKVKE